MATRVLIPVDSTAAASNAYEAVHELLPEDARVVFVRVLTPDEDVAKSRARAGLVKCLMVYRTRGIDCDMQMIEADTIATGIIETASQFEAEEIICVRGHGADDPTGFITELGNLTDLPIKETSEERETASTR